MMNESSALGSFSFPLAEDADDFDAIRAAIMASTRGRSFLQEYARRSRHADLQQVLTAISRIEGVIRERSGEPYQSFSIALRELARLIADAPVVDTPVANTSAESPEPQASDADRDDPPAQERAQSQDDVFAVAERIRRLALSLRERGAAPATCDQIEAIVAAISLAPALRDPAGIRAQQLTEVLGHLERRIRAMLDGATAVRAQPEPTDDSPSSGEEREEEQHQVASSIQLVQTNPSVPRSSARLLEGMNAFAAFPADAASPATTAPNMTDAAPLPDITNPSARSSFAPERDAEREQRFAVAESPSELAEARPEAGQVREPAIHASAPGSTPTAPTQPLVSSGREEREPPLPPAPQNDPLAALMSLSDEERIALFS
jgi:hypothetical protein